MNIFLFFFLGSTRIDRSRVDDETSHTSKYSRPNELDEILSSTSRNTVRQSTSTDRLHSCTPTDGLPTTTSAEEIRHSTTVDGLRTSTNEIRQSTSTDINSSRRFNNTSRLLTSTPTHGPRSSTPLDGICQSTLTDGLNSSRRFNTMGGIPTSISADQNRHSNTKDGHRRSTPTNEIQHSTSTNGLRNSSISVAGVHCSTHTDGIRRCNTGLQTFMSNQRELINLIREERSERQHLYTNKDKEVVPEGNRIILPNELGLPLENLEDFRVFNAGLSEPDKRAKFVIGSLLFTFPMLYILINCTFYRLPSFIKWGFLLGQKLYHQYGKEL